MSQIKCPSCGHVFEQPAEASKEHKPLKPGRYLFFDTETNGLPKDYKAPVSNVENWPRVVQMAWIVCDATGKELSSFETLIKPDGWTITPEVTKIHSITPEMAEYEGKPIRSILDEFWVDIKDATCLIAHNYSFDRKVLGAEFIRGGDVDHMSNKNSICTMMSSTKFCAIPGPYGAKWPKLHELHMKLFGKGFEGAHGALADVRATARCFYELVRLGVINYE